MALPVGRIDAGIGNGVAAVDHHAIADVDSNVRRANGVIGFLKENQVTRLCIRRRDIAAFSSQTVGCCTPNAPPIAAVIDDPADEAGTVKTGAWGTATPHIRHTQILFGFLNHPRELFIRKGFRWNIILETTTGATSTACADTARCAAAVCRGACAEQFRAVAVGHVVGIVPPGLLLVHVLPRDGIEALIFQQDIEDILADIFQCGDVRLQDFQLGRSSALLDCSAENSASNAEKSPAVLPFSFIRVRTALLNVSSSSLCWAA